MKKEIFTFLFSSLKAYQVKLLLFLHILGPPASKAFLEVVNFFTAPQVLFVCAGITITAIRICSKALTEYLSSYGKRKGDLRAKKEMIDQMLAEIQATDKERKAVYNKVIKSIFER